LLAAEDENGGSGDVAEIDVFGEEARRLLDSSRVPPQPALRDVSELMPSTFGKSREGASRGLISRRVAAMPSSWPER